MLEKILRTFSLSALKKLAGTNSLEFFEDILSIDSDYYESNNQNDLLIQAILNSSPVAMFYNKDTREFFIDRMNVKDILSVVEKINGEKPIRVDYDSVKKFCLNETNLSYFLEVMGLQNLGNPLVKKRDDYDAFKSIKPKYGLYPYQVEVSNKVFHSIETRNRQRAIIHLPTGAGKTRTAMHIVCRHLMTKENALVLWLANSDILCEQASEEFREAWSYLGNREVLQGKFYKNNNFMLNSMNSGFIVGGLQKLHAYYKSLNSYSDKSLDKKLTLIIFDEAHRALATTYKELVDRLLEHSPQAKLIGLT